MNEEALFEELPHAESTAATPNEDKTKGTGYRPERGGIGSWTETSKRHYGRSERAGIILGPLCAEIRALLARMVVDPGWGLKVSGDARAPRVA